MAIHCSGDCFVADAAGRITDFFAAKIYKRLGKEGGGRREGGSTRPSSRLRSGWRSLARFWRRPHRRRHFRIFVRSGEWGEAGGRGGEGRETGIS